MNNEVIEIYADGSCKPNPGVGGYAAIVKYEGHIRIVYGRLPESTSPKAELSAVIEALKLLVCAPKNYYDVYIYSDSTYVTDSINENRVEEWYARNFKNVSNANYWKRLLNLLSIHRSYCFINIPRNSCEDHQRVDRLAKMAVTLDD